MRIRFEMEGGIAHFPGLARPFTVDTTLLPAAEAEQAVKMVAALADEKRARTSPPGAADLRAYTLTIEDASRSRTLRLSDPLGESEGALVAFLRAKQRAERTRED